MNFYNSIENPFTNVGFDVLITRKDTEVLIEALSKCDDDRSAELCVTLQAMLEQAKEQTFGLIIDMDTI
jgi:hypothetical protein